jgi:hypothetical protein
MLKASPSSTDGVLLVGSDEAALFDAMSTLVDVLTNSGAWPFGKFNEEPRREYARRGGARYLETPARSTVVSDTTSYASRCREFVSRCRPDALLDGSRRVIAATDVCRLPQHVQDAMCKVIDECCDRAVYVLTAVQLSRVRCGVQSRLQIVRVPVPVSAHLPSNVDNVRMLAAEQAIKKAQAGPTGRSSFKIRDVALAAIGCMDRSAEGDAECARIVEVLAEADHILAQMASLCGDGIESTAQQDSARRKLVLDAAVERLKK